METRVVVATVNTNVNESTPFFSGRWAGEYQDWEGDVGIAFVAEATFTVTALGRYAAKPLAETTTLTLWAADTKEALASVEVGPRTKVEDFYAFEALGPEGVTAYAGSEYRLSQKCVDGCRWLDTRATAGQLESQVASRYAKLIGGAYNVMFGYPFCTKPEGHHAGLVNFKIAPEVGSFAFDPTSLVDCLKDRLEEETGIIPLQQQLRVGSESLQDGDSLERAGVHDGVLLTLSIQPGALVITASLDGSARLWSAENGTCLRTFVGHSGPVLAADFSQSNSLAFTASEDCTARLWSVNTGECVWVFEGHRDAVRAASISSQSTVVITGSDDRAVRLWSVHDGRCIHEFLGHVGPVVSVAFAPDGLTAVSASFDGRAKLWSVDTLEYLRTLEGHAGSVLHSTFSKNSPFLLTMSVDVDKPVIVWGLECDGLKKTLCPGLQVTSAGFSPDGAFVLTACGDWTARVWSVECDDCLRVFQHACHVTHAAFSPDGALVATACADFTARLWNFETSDCVGTLDGHTGELLSVHFSPDGLFVATASADCTARHWSVEGVACAWVFEGHSARVVHAAFSS